MAVLKVSEPGAADKEARREFPLSFWYHHRAMGNVMQRYGFTLESLSKLGHGDWTEAHAARPVVTTSPDGSMYMGGSRDWTGTPDCRWWHWLELMDDIPNVGPRRMLELVNYLRSIRTELPWFADFDYFSAEWRALEGCHREPPVIFRQVTWDGKDLAAVQTATALVPRRHGCPCAEVDARWNLKINGEPVAVGSVITVTEAGGVSVDVGH